MNQLTRMFCKLEGGLSRLARERQFHDDQAACRSSSPNFEDNLRLTDNWYLEHASWISNAINSLGPIFGKCILDWGSGHGMASTLLTRRGAHVIATDLSGGYCKEAFHRGLVQGQKFGVVQADGIRLPFPDSFFDGIWGHAMLHHLNMNLALEEIARVLKPGGRFVFCDPFEGSFLVRWARRIAGWRRGHRTDDEMPLNWTALCSIRRQFPNVIATFWDIPCVISGRIPGNWPNNSAISHCFSRYVVVSNNGFSPA